MSPFFPDGHSPETQEDIIFAAKECLQNSAMMHAQCLIDLICDEEVRMKLAARLDLSYYEEARGLPSHFYRQKREKDARQNNHGQLPKIVEQ